MAQRTFTEARARADLWGRLVENAVGGHLLAAAATGALTVSYWREGVDEVDYVVERGSSVVAIEVKSGRPRPSRGLDVLRKRHPGCRALVIGSGGIPLEQFFETPAARWIDSLTR